MKQKNYYQELKDMKMPKTALAILFLTSSKWFYIGYGALAVYGFNSYDNEHLVQIAIYLAVISGLLQLGLQSGIKMAMYGIKETMIESFTEDELNLFEEMLNERLHESEIQAMLDFAANHGEEKMLKTLRKASNDDIYKAKVINDYMERK